MADAVTGKIVSLFEPIQKSFARARPAANGVRQDGARSRRRRIRSCTHYDVFDRRPSDANCSSEQWKAHQHILGRVPNLGDGGCWILLARAEERAEEKGVKWWRYRTAHPQCRSGRRRRRAAGSRRRTRWRHRCVGSYQRANGGTD